MRMEILTLQAFLSASFKPPSLAVETITECLRRGSIVSILVPMCEFLSTALCHRKNSQAICSRKRIDPAQ